MDRLGELFMIIFVWALFCSPFVWYYFRTKKKQKEAVERQRAQEEQKRLEWEKREAERQREREQREAEHQRELAEAARARQEKLDAAYAEYDRIMESLEVYPIAVSDTKAEKIKLADAKDITYSTITKKTDLFKLGDFVVVDTETTGLNYGSCEIIEIAAIRFRYFEPVAIFSTLLSPTKGSISDETTRINHITNEMVVGQPCFQEIAESFLSFIGSDNLVGHNLPFDLKFIIHYGADVTKTKRKYYDTLALAQKTIKKKKMKWDKELECYIEDWNSDGVSDYKLDTLRSYLGIVTKESHRAEADAMATGVLFEMLSDMRS